MASVFRRKSKTGNLLTRWSYRWTDADGIRRSGTGSTDRAATLRQAQKLETEASLVRSGVIDPRDKTAAEYGLTPIARHVENYEAYLTAKGDTPLHTRRVASVLRRLFSASRVDRLAGMAQPNIQGALYRIREARSPRTANNALGALKAFMTWCALVGILRENPGWLRMLKPFNERVGLKRIRRALTEDELVKLVAASPPEHAAVYILATATGFRANELRNLQADDFRLEGDDPHVLCRAAYSKHRREDRQPIRRADVQWLLFWLHSREGLPVLDVPEKTAKMLRVDLAAAGIPYQTNEGVVDFHALRATYITLLAKSGCDPKRLQKLARHSTITLTLDRYVKVTDSDLRQALEGK